jgi:hypothetical protein
MISKGQDWGRRAVVPVDVVVCTDDAAAGAVVAAARGRSEDMVPVLLTGGDLHRTLGGVSGPSVGVGDEATQVSCDVGEVLVDGQLHWFVAHLVIGGPWWLRPTTVVANAAFWRSANMAPRAHPGDGKLDMIEARLALRQRLLSRRRLRSGSHIPHPDISTSRWENNQLDLGPRGDRVSLDGVAMGRAHRLVVRVEPSALVVYVG